MPTEKEMKPSCPICGSYEHKLEGCVNPPPLGKSQGSPHTVPENTPWCPACGTWGHTSGDCPATVKDALASKKIEARDQEALRKISDNAKIFSILYDLDLLPEQLEKGTRDWAFMLIIIKLIETYQKEIKELQEELDLSVKLREAIEKEFK